MYLPNLLFEKFCISALSQDQKKNFFSKKIKNKTEFATAVFL